MDFKQSVIENAWWGISVDYGMLHLQLATPTAVLVVILFMIFVLNKLLFKPVLRTLDNRKETIENSQKKVLSSNEELELLENESISCRQSKRAECTIQECFKLSNEESKHFRALLYDISFEYSSCLVRS